MARQIMQSTQVAISLSINAEIKTDHGDRLVTITLFPLTVLFMLIWNVRLYVNRQRFIAAMFYRDLANTLTVAGKILTIGAIALLWGVT